ncbi:unnamed protein product [Orchesella dallaii]|uniref:Uncharacterized protein n=1 Tax=Orchesella dallaii TaxID=48710 RepID=A0ABP1QX59_9HEXA
MVYLASFTFIVLAFISGQQATFIRRYTTNLILYGDYSPNDREVLYTNSDNAAWKNLSQLAEDRGLPMKALLCGVGQGAWLAYPKADFKYEKDGEGYILLIIGDACISASGINSVQPVGQIMRKYEGLVTYTEPYFMSDPVEMLDNSSTAAGVKSMIYAGDGDGAAWTVDGGGQKYCVYRPEGLISPGYCILSDLETQLGIAGGASVTWGCEGNSSGPSSLSDENNYQLQTCFSVFGVYRLLDNYFQLPVLKSVCGGGADPPSKLGFYKLVDAWKFRMNPDKQLDMDPAKLEKDDDDIRMPMRIRMLTYFFQIFSNGCPAVDPIYFNLIRYIFMQHIKTTWEEAPQILDRNDTNRGWKRAFIFLRSCHETRLNEKVNFDPSFTCSASHPKEGPIPDEEADVVDLMLAGPHLDHVIEQVWIMLNYVSPYCASVNNFVDNLWVDFTNLFRREVLLPLLQQWVNPGTWQTYYEFMFNGYSIEEGKREIIRCVQSVFRLTPHMDPVDRPSSMISEFLELAKNRPPVILDNLKSPKIKREVASAESSITKSSAHQMIAGAKKRDHHHPQTSPHSNRSR